MKGKKALFPFMSFHKLAESSLFNALQPFGIKKGAGLDRGRVNFVEPGFQGCEQAVCGAVVETPFAFLEVEGELGPWDAIVAAQMALGLVPEVLDAVDVVSPVGELLAMVDAHVVEPGHVEHVVGLETVAID